MENILNEVQIKYCPNKTIPYSESYKSSSEIYRLLIDHIYDPDTICHHEYFTVLMFNTKSKLLGYKILNNGSLDGVSVDLRALMQISILSNARSIVICHNHPSMETKPSPSDDKLTEDVLNACKIFNIDLTDHLIITPDKYYSYCDDDNIL